MQDRNARAQCWTSSDLANEDDTDAGEEEWTEGEGDEGKGWRGGEEPQGLHLENRDNKSYFKSVLYVCESVSVSWISSFVSYFRFHILVISYGIWLSLSDLLHLV